jgi:hypothetical protein
MTMGRRRSTQEAGTIGKSDKETGVRIPNVSIAACLVLVFLAVLACYNLVKYEAADIWVWVTAITSALIAAYILLPIKVADQWEKAVILRFGRFTGLRGPGIFWVVPIVNDIPA